MKKGIDYVGVTVSFLCHDGEGNFVLQKRSTNCRDEHGRWDCGGGSLDFGEKVEDALMREIKEEFMADVLEYTFVNAREAHRMQNDIPTHWISLDHLVRVDRQTVQNGEPHKFDEIKWFTLDALPAPLHSMLPILLAEPKVQKVLRK